MTVEIAKSIENAVTLSELEDIYRPFRPKRRTRATIAKRLMEYANLKKDVVLVGANTRLEIWDSEEWDRYQDELSDDIMMDGILNYGLNI